MIYDHYRRSHVTVPAACEATKNTIGEKLGDGNTNPNRITWIQCLFAPVPVSEALKFRGLDIIGPLHDRGQVSDFFLWNGMLRRVVVHGNIRSGNIW